MWYKHKIIIRSVEQILLITIKDLDGLKFSKVIPFKSPFGKGGLRGVFPMQPGFIENLPF